MSLDDWRPFHMPDSYYDPPDPPEPCCAALSQAIPPDYTEFIGAQLLAHIRQEAVA